MTASEEDTRRAFRAVFDAELDYVLASLRRLGVDARDVEDVAHDLFLEVYRRFADYDRARPVKPWLFAFAFRFASDYRRLARHRREVLPDRPSDPGGALASAASEAPAADAALAAGEARALVSTALDALDPDRRAVFILHEVDGAAMPEIAAALGIPVNTAYSRLRSARQLFTAAVRRIQARVAGGAPRPALEEGST